MGSPERWLQPSRADFLQFALMPVAPSPVGYPGVVDGRELPIHPMPVPAALARPLSLRLIVHRIR
jgi:hypothetical protein